MINKPISVKGILDVKINVFEGSGGSTTEQDLFMTVKQVWREGHRGFILLMQSLCMLPFDIA